MRSGPWIFLGVGALLVAVGTVGMVWATNETSLAAIALGSASASLIFVGVVFVFAARATARRAPLDTAVRVGVTGHRHLADPDAVGSAVDAVLDELDGGGRRPLEVWSALADGADRIVVDRVLARPRSRLAAVLPLAADDYRHDFDDRSGAELDRLLDTATTVEVTGPDAGGTRESAYERAGLRVVEACDVLVAVWDGGPSGGRGGTADIVEAARERGRRTVVVTAVRA